MIRDLLSPTLQARFPNHGFRTTDSDNVIGVFPASHQEVGDLVIHDDGDEATLFIGHLTHLHFEFEADEKEPEKRMTDEVVEFLDELFGDRILIWKSRLTGADGAMPLEDASVFSTLDSSDYTYVWSGPITNPKRLPAGTTCCSGARDCVILKMLPCDAGECLLAAPAEQDRCAYPLG